MPREHAEHAQQVINILKFRDALAGWSVVPLHDALQDDVPRIMGESMIFLSFSSASCRSRAQSAVRSCS